MWIEITHGVIVNGEPTKAGSIVEVDTSTAMLLIGMRRAVETVKPEPEPKPVEAPAVQPTKPVSRRGRTSSSTPKD
jgi:hypothetical protein